MHETDVHWPPKCFFVKIDSVLSCQYILEMIFVVQGKVKLADILLRMEIYHDDGYLMTAFFF